MLTPLKRLGLVFGILLSTLNIAAQPETELTEQEHLLSFAEANDLQAIVNKSPFLYEECLGNDCTAIAEYHHRLYNFRQDLQQYYNYLRFSRDVARDQWETYIKENIRNENLKAKFQMNLAYKDYFSKFASVFIDISTIYQSFKSGKVPLDEEAISLLSKSIKAIDIITSALNLIFTDWFNTPDGTTAKINNAWNLFYSSIRSGTTLVYDAIGIYRTFKKDNPLDVDAKSVKGVFKLGNILTAVFQVLNLWSTYERNEMGKAIAEFDKVLQANEQVIPTLYNSYKGRQYLLDKIKKILLSIGKIYPDLYVLHLRCNGKQVRATRKLFAVNELEYPFGLIYYKEILLEYNKTLLPSWGAVKPCDSLRNFTFEILDGIGNPYSPYITITRIVDGKKLYAQQSSYFNKKNKFALLPGIYRFELFQGTAKDGARIAATQFEREIEGNENTEIVLRPYGRVSLEVVEKSGIARSYAYSFQNDNNNIIDNGFATRKVLVDLPVNSSLHLNLTVGYSKKIVKQFYVSCFEIQNYRYIYDSEKFKLLTNDIPDLNGDWTSDDYNCEGATNKTLVKIKHLGNYISATKIDAGGDRCVPDGYRTFYGNVVNLKGKIFQHVGSPQDPSSGIITVAYEIINDKLLMVGNQKFVKVNK